MRAFLKSLIMLSVLSGATLQLCPEGGVKRIISVLCTAILAAAIVSPLRSVDLGSLFFEEELFREAEDEIVFNSRAGENLLKKMALRENCENYIIDRAAELGMRNIGAEVEFVQSGDGWIPYAARICAEGPPETADRLRSLIRDNLGIPPERQDWKLNE